MALCHTFSWKAIKFQSFLFWLNPDLLNESFPFTKNQKQNQNNDLFKIMF